MRILSINTGGSSFKYQLFDMETETAIAGGNCERIGEEGSFITHVCKKSDSTESRLVVHQYFKTHDDAFAKMLELLLDQQHGAIRDVSEISAVGHRVVQGANIYSAPTLVNDEVVLNIEKLSSLAPIHNAVCATAIRACMGVFKAIPEVAVFDSQFHATIPDYAYLYGLPYEYYERYGVRKYGFHGISNKYVNQQCCELVGKDQATLRVICCHLGNGCSVTAISGGKSIDTSMGFTPADGLLMGTRCGSIDPGCAGYLMQKEGLSYEQLDELLSKKSGYLGVSGGCSSDSRKVVAAAEAGDRLAALVLRMQSYQVKKYIGGYTAAMNGLDMLVFTGGIGENSHVTRELVCADLDFFSLWLDKDLNRQHAMGSRCVSKKGSKDIWIIPTNEELVIARETKQLLWPQ
ncbi:MAG: acetate kinase [Oscillospiraceae bacterium]|jgi:acetate kinase|nr:acetate kinase [Oscillospiraceae bacterium]